jgi:hypothetical protein
LTNLGVRRILQYMAFTGTAVVKQISDRIVRITGVSLVAAASGTIGLFGATGTAPGVTLPEAFKTLHYSYAGVNVPFVDAIEVTAQPAAVGTATAIPVAVVKTGSTLADFRATITNTHGSIATALLEIVVKFHE